MTKGAMVRARIQPRLKADAEKVFDLVGLKTRREPRNAPCRL